MGKLDITMFDEENRLVSVLNEGIWTVGILDKASGVAGSQVKIFSHDGNVTQDDFTALENSVNTWLLANPTHKVFATDFHIIERVAPSPDLYTKVVLVHYVVA